MVCQLCLTPLVTAVSAAEDDDFSNRGLEHDAYYAPEERAEQLELWAQARIAGTVLHSSALPLA